MLCDKGMGTSKAGLARLFYIVTPAIREPALRQTRLTAPYPTPGKL